MTARRPTAPGTKGYPEQQPTPNDKREMPDANTPHEPQNKPQAAGMADGAKRNRKKK
jgi:hypothetical protein